MKKVSCRIAAVLLLLAAVIIVGPASEGIASTYSTAPDDGVFFDQEFQAGDGMNSNSPPFDIQPGPSNAGGAPGGKSVKMAMVVTPIPPSVLLLGSGLLGILGIGLRRRKS